MASPSPPLVPPSPSPPIPPPPATTTHSNHSSDLRQLHDLPQISSNEAIKAYASLSIKLSEMTTEFLQKLASAQKAHSQQLSGIVTFFKRKAQDIQRNWVHCDGTHFTVWNSLIKSTEEEAKAYSDLSNSLLENVSTDLQTHVAKKKLLIKKLFQYRASMNSKVEKSEAEVQKCFKEYCDQWNKYGESLDKEQVKETQILLSYNHHNTYVLQKAGFSSLHDIFYNEHIYTMLDEIQSIHNALLNGYADRIIKFIEVTQKKLDSNQLQLRNLQQSAFNVNSSIDISQFIVKHPSTVKYPPPKPLFQLPESNNTKLPILSDNLQLIDLTQAPLLHLLEDLKTQEQVLIAEREKLQTEYQSEKGLFHSYQNNPALGDAHDIEVEMTHMRHVMREKDSEIQFVKGKLEMFSELEDTGFGAIRVSEPQASLALLNPEAGKNVDPLPRRTSEMFIQGKEHDWVELNKKFPVQCRYCSGFIQAPLRAGYVCTVCRIAVHTKCQKSVPYCSGEAPTPKSPKLSKVSLRKVYKKIKGQGPSSSSVKEENDSVYSESGEIHEAGGIYCTIDDKTMGVGSYPEPPPREQSLDPKRQSQPNFHRESMFEPSGEWDPPTHCVALYDYDKYNPNDMPLKSGDVIELLNTASSDWWKGTARNKKGYFPAQYVQVVSPGDCVYRALYDFTPSADGEMALSEGQVMIVPNDSSNTSDGWVNAIYGGRGGLVPKNYLEKLSIV